MKNGRITIISREGTSEIYNPRVYFLSYCFQIYYLKTQKYPAALFIYLFYFVFVSNLIQFNLSQYRGIDNPSYALCCKYLLFVCRYYLHSVAWFSYWIDKLGFTTQGNTCRCCAASSSSLRGKQRRYKQSVHKWMSKALSPR